MELLDQCDVLVDVGNVFNPQTKRFDHHQSSFKDTLSTLRPDLKESSDIRLSSAGLIYVHYGEEIISEILKNDFKTVLTGSQLEAIFKKMYTSFIQGELIRDKKIKNLLI